MKKFFILLPIVLLFSVLSCSTSDSSSSPVSNGGTEPETPEEYVPYLARYKYTAVKGEHLVMKPCACDGYRYTEEGFAVDDKDYMYAVFVSKDTSVTPNTAEYYMTAKCGYYIDDGKAVLIPNGKFYTKIDPETNCFIDDSTSEVTQYLARYLCTVVAGENLSTREDAADGYVYTYEGYAVPNKLNMEAVFISEDTSVTPNKAEYYMTADCGYYIDEENAVLIPNGKFYTHIDPKTDCWIE